MEKSLSEGELVNQKKMAVNLIETAWKYNFLVPCLKAVVENKN